MAKLSDKPTVAEVADMLLYLFGRSLLGNGAGSLITELKQMFGLVEAAMLLKTAAAKSDAREYLCAVLKNNRKPVFTDEARR